MAALVICVSLVGMKESAVSERAVRGPLPQWAHPGSYSAKGRPASAARSETCRVVKMRATIGTRRLATWHWTSVLGLPRTPTRYRERDTRSCRYLYWLRALWSARADATWRMVVRLRDPRKAICFVFGDYCAQALRVAECESHLNPRAHNGQYLGTFQMGSYARSRYGHGDSALEQARAAYRYFVESGRDWSPWSCGWAA